MTREQFLEVADEIARKREGYVPDAMAKRDAVKACNLGLCGKTDTLDRLAQVAMGATVEETQERRALAKLQADGMRTEAAIAWTKAEQVLDKLQLTEAVLRDCANGLV